VAYGVTVLAIVWHTLVMAKRSSRDVNQIAAAMVRQTAGLELKGKNPAAVALGRLGGKKGGKARAEKLSPDQRKEIARLGAVTRWQKRAQ
jgi:hypothetical protein